MPGPEAGTQFPHVVPDLFDADRAAGRVASGLRVAELIELDVVDLAGDWKLGTGGG
jgi:hypothetical protein